MARIDNNFIVDFLITVCFIILNFFSFEKDHFEGSVREQNYLKCTVPVPLVLDTGGQILGTVTTGSEKF